MVGEPAGIFSTKKRGLQEALRFSPNQLDELNQLHPLSKLNQVNQVNKEIEMISISKGPPFFFRAFGPMEFY